MTREEVLSLQDQFGTIIVSHEEIANLGKTAGLSDLEVERLRSAGIYHGEDIDRLCRMALSRISEAERKAAVRSPDAGSAEKGGSK